MRRMRRAARKSLASAAEAGRENLSPFPLRTWYMVDQYRDANLAAILRVGDATSPGGRRPQLAVIVSHVLNIELGRFSVDRHRRRCFLYLLWGGSRFRYFATYKYYGLNT